MKQESVFDNLYKNLNLEQKKAVDTIDGPVMVIAGPGTGKTSILTLRIANILKQTDTSPDSILALTFTESGVYAMRKKLVSIVGPGAYKVTINTFHGFANDLIKNYPERFERIISSSPISDIEQFSLIRNIIENNNFNHIKPYGDPFYYVKHIVSEIKNIKREAIDSEELKKRIESQKKNILSSPDLYHEKGAHKGKMKGEYSEQLIKNEKNLELALVFEKYKESLAKNKFYDYEDMLIELIMSLKKDKEFLLILQEKYQYVLADEHQDANNAQNSILELLSNFHSHPNLFIVGDEKQAIYRFQGASLDNFLYFKKLYPEAVLINLEHNYRSNQKILDASHSLIENNILPQGMERIKLKAGIKTESKDKHSIKILQFLKPDFQYQFIAENILEKIKKGVKPQEIALIYRENRDAFPISRILAKNGIDFKIESDEDILEDQDIRKLMIILTSINDLSDDLKLSEALFVDYLGLKPLEVFEMIRDWRNRPSQDKKSLANILAQKRPELFDKMERWSKLAKEQLFTELFEIVSKESGSLASILSSDNTLQKLGSLEVFFNEIRKMSGSKKNYFLSNFLNDIEIMKEHGIYVRNQASPSDKVVRLMTAHRSKGLEFEYVYILDANDGHFGNKKRKEYFNLPLYHTDHKIQIKKSDSNMEDERRLFYVAMTRAKSEVYISYANSNTEGKEILPCQFIEEISQELREKVDTESFENQNRSIAINLSIGREDKSLSKEDKDRIKKDKEINKEYLNKIFLDQGLSVTALNNYLVCPWRFFFVNLIRLPQVQNKTQLYGIAIHDTLRTFFDKYREENDIGEHALIALFESNLSNKALSPSDYDQLLKKGKKAISGYYKWYKDRGAWNANLITEYRIKGVHLPFESQRETLDIVLNGQLDKIEFIESSGQKVNVVDYKTKAPISRNEIEGNTKSASGNEKRQLVFYKILLDLYGHQDHFANNSGNKLEMISGEIDFIEPNNKGDYKKEKFDINKEEVEALKALIQKSSAEIYDLSFIKKPACGEKDCQYCELSKMINI